MTFAVDRAAILLHRGGVVFDEIDFPEKLPELALGAQQLVRNDVGDEDALCSALHGGASRLLESRCRTRTR